jgi:hypothetical protein
LAEGSLLGPASRYWGDRVRCRDEIYSFTQHRFGVFFHHVSAAERL